MASVVCNRCDESFARQGNLTRHKNRKNRCDSMLPVSRTDQASERLERKRKISNDKSEEIAENDDDGNEIPTFDGDEFSGKKPKSHETLYKMIDMLKIPDRRRESITTEMLQEERARTVKDLDSEDESDDEDGPLTESELQELIDSFRTLYFNLVHKGHRQNVSELLDILKMLLEADEITRADYLCLSNTILSIN